MRWRGERQSTNIEDRRGLSGGKVAVGGGIGTIVILILAVQNLMGISDRVDSLQRQVSEVEANQLSVRLELQADFFAGLFARYVQNQGVLEAGDIEEALRAASAIGDDTIQRRTSGYVVPDSFTHGTSEQRLRWFKKGYESGDMRQGDTFNARSL